MVFRVVRTQISLTDSPFISVISMRLVAIDRVDRKLDKISISGPICKSAR